MLVLGSEAIRSLVVMPDLIDCLQDAFRTEYVVPARKVSKMPGGEGERLFLSMQAFDRSGCAVAKLATVFPDNRVRGRPTIQSVIVAFSDDGAPMAVLDGAAVTQLRTAAASALASKYLSRADSARLVIIGTGALAPTMVTAHCAVRPINFVSVCGRQLERATETAAAIRSLVNRDIEVFVPKSTEEAVASADIVCCATSSCTPVLAGRWLRPGVFVDLVGSFSPSKREADDDVILRSRIFVDAFEGALTEAGDILDPIRRAVISRQKIEGELADLVCGRVAGRVSPDEIIVFKSVGTAIEDLAVTQLIVTAARRECCA